MGNSGSTAAVQEEDQQGEQVQSVTDGNNHQQVVLDDRDQEMRSRLEQLQGLR